jgi:hypothetical protein
MSTRHSVIPLGLMAVLAGGIIAQEPPVVVPDAQSQTQRADALRQRIRVLEREKAKIDAHLEAARRELDRMRRMDSPEAMPPAADLRERLRFSRPGSRILPDLRSAPRSEQMPPGSVPGEINGMRFYLIPLAKEK